MLIYLQMIESNEDRSKFEQLYILYRGLMLYVAKRILRNQEDAEDAVHQAFVSIIENLRSITDINSPKTRSFCVIICERKAIDIYRSKRRIIDADFNEAIVGVEVPLPDDTLAATIAGLPPKYREILLLRYDNGYTTKEIAKMFGISVDAAQKTLWRAKTELKRKLEEEGML